MMKSAERVVAAAEQAPSRAGIAWAGSIMGIIALGIAAAALVSGPNWTLLWAAFVVAVLAVATGSVVRRLGYGRS